LEETALGAIKGSISYTRFYVQGDLPDDYQDAFVQAIQARAFEPLKHDSDEEQGHGWCVVDKPFDLQIEHEKVFANEYLNLALRIDRWRLPGPLLKAKLAEAEAAFMEKFKRDRLGKRQKEEIKITVVRQLRKQTIPAMKLIDLSWNTNEKILRFWSKSTKVFELFQELFEKTFKLKLIPESPYTSAMHLGLTKDQIESLSNIEPTIFNAQAGDQER